MKTLGLCLVLAAALIPLAAAQTVKPQPQGQPNQGMNLDDDAMKKLLEQNDSLKKLQERYPDLKIGPARSFRLKSSTGEPEPDCGTMRTYRVKREAPGSDEVRPSGYSTCVPLAKFRIQDAVKPEMEPDPAQ